MKILLDTSVLIDYTRQSNNPNSFFSKLVAKNHDFYISDITVAEMYAGKYVWESKAKRTTISLILKHLTKLPTNGKVALLAGQIRATTHIALLDALIAATAIHHKLPLATLNTKDFSSIPHLKLVKLP